LNIKRILTSVIFSASLLLSSSYRWSRIALKKLTERSRLKRQVASKTVTRGDYAVAAVRYYHAFLK
jgi:hypothetical protein